MSNIVKNNRYNNIDDNIKEILHNYKNNVIDEKETSISLENIYKNEFTSFGNKKVYARYGITRSGKILIDFKKNGKPISLSLNECYKINNILSSRNFENYINSKKSIIEERNKQFFDNLKKKRENNRSNETTENNENNENNENENNENENNENENNENNESTENNENNESTENNENEEINISSH